MRQYSLPGWAIEPVFSEVVSIEELHIDAYGIVGRHTQYGEAYGASAGIGVSADKAWYEFLERACTLENIYRERLNNELGQNCEDQLFCEQYEGATLSKSNGVALHKTIEAAQHASALELIERHVVLESWCGNAPPPKRVERDIIYGQAIKKTYSSGVYQFEAISHDSYDEIDVAMVVLTPRHKENPFCYGFGAGRNLEQAITKAESEALQRLAFLWGEDIPRASPSPIEANASFHQEYYLFPENQTHFESWLNGHFMTARSRMSSSRQQASHIEFANITTPSVSELGYYVVKAKSKQMQALFFGKPPHTGSWSSICAEQMIHPIA